MNAMSISEVCDVNPRLATVTLRGDDPVAFVGMAELDDVEAVATDRERRPYAEVAKGYTPFLNGDVLVAKITPCFQNNKIGVARTSTRHAFGSTEFHVLRPREDTVDRRYLLHFLRRADVLRHGEMRMTGAGGQRRVPSRFFDELQIPLPPIEEQRRIAAVLDTADDLRAKRREALAKLDTLTQAIFIHMFGDPANGWRGSVTKPLAELIRVSSGQALPQQSITPGPYPVYGGNGVNAYHDRYLFEEPQIVIGRVGVYCGVVHQAPPRCWITDNALRVVEMDGALTPGFLSWALRVADLNQYANQAAQPLISGSRIYPVEIAVPPMASQQEFDTRASEVARQLMAHRSSSEGLDELFASLQQRAFRGEL